MRRRCRLFLLGTFLIATTVTSQALASDDPPLIEESATDAAAAATTGHLLIDTLPAIVEAQAEGRPCPGCPRRRVGASLLQATIINGFYGLANLIRGQDTAKITPKTWWTNMKRGWEWDLDDFVVNQIGHPYQGNNYFNAGRANGLSFWESAAVTAFGSSTWEYFGETNQASLNDFLNTTLGGIALGEMFHRTAWLVRNTQLSGGSRRWKEIAATAIDPVTGVNRFISGDASVVGEKPADMVPSSLGATLSAGALWRGSNTQSVEAAWYPFLEMDLLYGDPRSERSREPYDAFDVRLTFGGGSAFSEAAVRGRLLNQPFRNGGVQLAVSQSYLFNANDAYRFGAQAAETSVGFAKRLSSRTTFWAQAYGGVTILGAVDSLPPGETVAPDEPDDPNAGQGVSTGPRNYDYGPGSNAGGIFDLRHDRRTVLLLSYELHHLYVLDGIRANHLLQRARADVRLPLRGRLGVGVTGEYFDRHTYYQIPDTTPAHFRFPQFRIALTWSAS